MKFRTELVAELILRLLLKRRQQKESKTNEEKNLIPTTIRTKLQNHGREPSLTMSELFANCWIQKMTAVQRTLYMSIIILTCEDDSSNLRYTPFWNTVNSIVGGGSTGS